MPYFRKTKTLDGILSMSGTSQPTSVRGFFTQKDCQITNFQCSRWKYSTFTVREEEREEESNRRHVSPTSRTLIYTVGGHPQ